MQYSFAALPSHQQALVEVARVFKDGFIVLVTSEQDSYITGEALCGPSK